MQPIKCSIGWHDNSSPDEWFRVLYFDFYLVGFHGVTLRFPRYSSMTLRFSSIDFNNVITSSELESSSASNTEI